MHRIAMPIVVGLILPAAAEPPRPAELAWFAEGEACADHQWSTPVMDNTDYAECYGGGMLVIASDEDPPEPGWAARFTAEVAEPGTYKIWLAATPPGAGSPLAVGVGDAEPVSVSGAGQGVWGPGGCFRWMECAQVGLSAGQHMITVLVTGRRGHDNQYYAYLDALGLERVGDDSGAPLTAYPPDVDVGPMPIRNYSGNGSVGWFMQYFGTQQGGSPGDVTEELIATLKRCGSSAYCDYLAWCRIEEQPGRWDFSFYRTNAERLHAAGLEYNVFCWLHFPPHWAEPGKDFVPYRCLEHGEDMRQSSLWAPQTLDLYERFYARLAADFGEEIDFIRLAMPAEYGEIGVPIGMTTWLVPQEHIHGGYWCGDDYALASFRERARELADDIAGLNGRWGCDFASWEDVSPPDVTGHAAAREAVAEGSPTRLRRWLDFVDWYQDSQAEFATRAVEIVRRRFPGKEIILSLGYGQEPVPWGNDQSRFIRTFRDLGVAAQTPGDIGYFATRRVSTACRLYGVPYFTEPPGSVDRQREVRRLFSDASNGTQTWFDYPQNMDGARDLLHHYKHHLTGGPPVCDVALMLPSSWWWLRPDQGWPPATERLGSLVRDRLDYEVVDELMVRDGGLAALGIRVLIMAEGDLLLRDTLEALEAWVREGGVLLVLGAPDLRDLDGDRSVAAQLLPPAVAQDELGDTTSSAEAAARLWARGRSVGAGRALSLEAGDDDLVVGLIAELTYRLSALGPARANAALVDDEADGIWATRMQDRILYYNTSPQLLRKRVQLRAEDFTLGTPQPTQWQHDLTLGPGAIEAIMLEPSG